MVPALLKELLIPGSVPFLVIGAAFGTLLLYRRKDRGRAGRVWLTGLMLFYWILATPVTAMAVIRLLTPEYPPVLTAGDSRGANAVVLLSAGVDIYRSRGEQIEVSTRQDALRVMEAARVYSVLDHPLIVVSGTSVVRTARRSEAAHMAAELEAMGVPQDRIVLEEQAVNTVGHAKYVPPLLAEHHIAHFVLVTSRQHIDRALRVFRKAGFDPVPSTPDLDIERPNRIENVLPSRAALDAGEQLIYDKLGLLYYWVRGWI